MSDLRQSFAAGYEGLSAWADLLDRINVFPVADGDTGTNLRISLAPLRDLGDNCENIPERLARTATGNSGNIAAAFFRQFCLAKNYADLAATAASGRNAAWQAIADPRAGTMLTVFDRLAKVLEPQIDVAAMYIPLSVEMQDGVRATSQLLPELKTAGVVDSGALAMYVFFDGFFRRLTRQKDEPCSILDLFAGKLVINSSFRPENSDSYCVDALIHMADENAGVQDCIAAMGESVVVVQDEAMLKVHLHTADLDRLRGGLGSFGDIVHWSAEEIKQGTEERYCTPDGKSALHIVTDAAGSMTREMARQLGLTLLDSYIITADGSRPESLYRPEQIYSLLRSGAKITTAQASNYERHQHYRSIGQQFGRCLYLSVGSAFTGNYATAAAWKKEHDCDDLLTVIDTGAASGRLALIALLTARQARRVAGPDEVVDFARKTIADCEEFVFIDELKYLVAGGRVSRASGFFGDLLSMKPIISPTSAGVRKVGVVHSRKGQLAFAMASLGQRFARSAAPVVMLQYTDNEQWVGDTVRHQVEALLPAAEILLVPLSLTSGVHMGPGTWSMAFSSAPVET
jgi:hypothetical protein